MSHKKLLEHVSGLLDEADVLNGALLHEHSGTHLLRHETPTGLDSTIYRPLLCLVLQGAKEVGTNTRTLLVQAGQSLIVSHALPVISRITQAEAETPYVALVFPIDLDLMRSLLPDVAPAQETKSTDSFSIRLCETDARIEGALLRFFEQCVSEQSRRLLAPITSREIHARLLIGNHGGMLQKLLWHESSANRIFQATRDIQSNLRKPIVVGDLAQHVGMSNSSFFEQFKAVTGTSPLQYQKNLRLLRARDELQTSSSKISEVAFSVGYESSAQFSREYSRKFGRSPRQDRGRVFAS